MKNTTQTIRTERSSDNVRMPASRPTASPRWSSRATRPRLVTFSWAAVTPTHRHG